MNASTTAGIAVSMDATAGAQGGPFTLATLVSQPAANAGTAGVLGLTITFVPKAGFAGTVTFMYALSNAFGTSQPAPVTIVVNARPDPSRNTDVSALAVAQTDAVGRFIDLQISNFSQRVDELNHGGGGGVDASGLAFSANGRVYAPFGKLVPANAGGPAAQRLGLWTAGTFGFGSDGGSPLRSAVSSGTTGFSAGLDYRLTPRLALGAGVGLARDVNALASGHDQGTNETASNVAAYGSLRLGERGFVGAVIGYGTVHLESRRFDALTSTMARGSRRGEDWFASLTAGQTYDTRSLRLSPYAGVRVTAATLHGYTETGAGIGALSFGDQALHDVSAVAGVRGSTPLTKQLGAIAPHFAIEYDRKLSSTGATPLWYADQPAAIFSVPSGTRGSAPLNLEVGTTVRLGRGFLFNADYRTMIDRAAVQHVLRIGVTTRL